ncbi:haloacid dehalogenase type II [Metabacillus endolithicus]|uniref:Haloacid dehalogenase type II n=2 Tax=Metabacillus endolithicus TaxID=1535204 RepID=A0ABW5BUK9_9BACI
MIKAIVFDVYGTLFNVHSVVEKCNSLYPGKGHELSELWRRKQLEYSFLRQLMGHYETFLTITKESLAYSCKSLSLPYNSEIEEILINEYVNFALYDEVEEVLAALENIKIALYSNGSLDMLKPLIHNSSINKKDIMLVSVDERKEYKPTPMSYQFVLKKLNVEREEVLFVSSNTWDIAGAKHFGFRTAWINRDNRVFDYLGTFPDNEYNNLKGII